MKVPKAYKNPDFLMGKDARTVRILCEYLEPAARFRDRGIRRAVIFFGSARLAPAPETGRDYFSEASDLAERFARWTVTTHPEADRYYVCCGGGPGIMEAAARGADRVDRRLNLGLNISLPFEQDGNDFVEAAGAFEFHYFFMRKFWFVSLAEAMVVFPGGFGTLDELFEVLTLVQTGKARRMPLVLYGREFWDEVVDFRALARRGLISPEDLDLFRMADSTDEAFEALTRDL